MNPTLAKICKISLKHKTLTQYLLKSANPTLIKPNRKPTSTWSSAVSQLTHFGHVTLAECPQHPDLEVAHGGHGQARNDVLPHDHRTHKVPHVATGTGAVTQWWRNEALSFLNNKSTQLPQLTTVSFKLCVNSALPVCLCVRIPMCTCLCACMRLKQSL